jgi:type IV pilus assembly protein PilV
MDLLRPKRCQKYNYNAMYFDMVPAAQGKKLAGNAGFSIVEALVSIVILTIVIIGAIGMQLVAGRTAQQTAYQTFVSHLAAEMGDAVRAGEQWASKNKKTNPYLGANFDAVVIGEPPRPPRSCYRDVCNPAEFAAFEIYEWKIRIRDAVPGGQFLICRDTSPWSSGQNALVWECHDSGEGVAPVVVKLGWLVRNSDGGAAKTVTTRTAPGIALTVSPGA